MNGKGSASDLDIYFVDDNGNPFPLIRIKPGLTGPGRRQHDVFIADIAAPIPG